jgi:DNA-binding NarL/FixJ family response regulator
VIRERDLALALGAALYLPKPVRRQEFIQALDLALHQAATRTTTVPANNAATG